MPLHRNLGFTHGHVAHSLEYADAAAREAASLEAADEGRIARQLDDDSFWILQDATGPVWLDVSGGGGDVLSTRALTAGAGLTGGGDLSADRTFNVGANADGSIVVNANDVQVGVLASDAQHGARGGGTQHATAVAGGAAGFISGASQQKLDNLPTTAVASSRQVGSGAGLTGGGDLSADRTLAVGANADGSIVVNADDVQVGVLASDAQHGVRGGGTQHATAVAGGAAGFISGASQQKLDNLPASAAATATQVIAGAGLTGGGDLSTNRTFDVVANADGSIVVNANDIQVGVIGDTQHGDLSGGNLHDLAVSLGSAGFMSGTDKWRLEDITDFLRSSSSSAIAQGGGVIPAGGLDVTVQAGNGWIRHSSPAEEFSEVTWAEVEITLAASETNYVFYDSVTDTITSSTTEPTNDYGILLATVVTDATGLRYLHSTGWSTASFAKQIRDYLYATRRVLLKSGLTVTNGTAPGQFSVAGGTYFLAFDPIAYAGAIDATFSYFYGTDGATEVPAQTAVSLTQFDSAGTLTAMTAGYFRADTLYLTSDGRLSVIYGTAEYSTQTLAEEATPALPATFMAHSAMPLAALIVEEGNDIVSFVDLRPTGAGSSGATGGGGGGVSDHGLLTGLSDDDHPQYLLADGTRALSGDLDLGTNDIVNVGDINSVAIAAHASRHAPGGADAIATAAPVTIGTANSAGTAPSLALSDHVHAHGAQSDSTLHAVAVAGGANGFLSGADKTKLDALVPHFEGVATVDFGAYPGNSLATTAITGQTGIVSGSSVCAWLMATATADHSVDEHIVDGPLVLAGNIVAGTGFTIYADAGMRGGRLYGLWSVAWSWS